MLGEKLKGHAYMHFMESVLAMQTGEGLIRPVGTWQDRPGWWLIPSAVRLCPGAALCYPEAAQSPYFHKLYTGIADDLASGKVALMGLEGREHTAQVRQEQREWREWRFRAVLADSRTLKGGGAASIATVGAAGLEVAQAVLAETQSAILPLIPYLETLRWVFIAVALIGVVVAIHARVDNWKMGQR